MNPYLVTKINKQYDGQIEYLLKLIDMHSKTMVKLQKQRTDELKNLTLDSPCYDKDCCVNDGIICRDNNNANFSDVLFDKLHNGNESQQPDGVDLCDEIINNQLDNQLIEKQPTNVIPCEENLDMGLGEQDLIWERIRNSQIEIEQKQLKNQHMLPSITENIHDSDEEDNPHIIFKSNNLSHNIEMDQIKEPDNTPPRINALYKVNPTSRKTIIRDIFKEATESIKKLSKLDDKYKDNFDNEVQVEADRLLEVYLKTH